MTVHYISTVAAVSIRWQQRSTYHQLFHLWESFVFVGAKFKKATTMDKHPTKHFRMCVSPCQRFLTPEDLCVMCLSEENASSVLEGAECAHCEKFFRDEGQGSWPPWLGTCDGWGKVETEFVRIAHQVGWKFKNGMSLPLYLTIRLCPSSPHIWHHVWMAGPCTQ